MIISKEKYFQDSESLDTSDLSPINDLYELLIEYSNSNDHDLFTNIKSGLNLLMVLEPVTSSSLFMLDEKEYIFKHLQTNPNENKAIVLDAFAEMIDEGTIATCLETGCLAVYINTDHGSDLFYIVSPLCTNESVLGIVIIESKIHPEELQKSLITILKLIINTFRMKLQLSMYSLKEKKTNMYIEQLASEKALNILNKEVREIKL
jgi:hypothetical protein